MGVDRALITVGLQSLLMTGVRNYGAGAEMAAHTHRLLATAASLDYVLMLATGAAGTRIPPDAARRAIHAGFARAVDDALALLRAVVNDNDAVVNDADADARPFVREGLRTLRAAIDAEALDDDVRSFALIALASDCGT